MDRWNKNVWNRDVAVNRFNDPAGGEMQKVLKVNMLSLRDRCCRAYRFVVGNFV